MLVRDAMLPNPLTVSPRRSVLGFIDAVLGSNQTTATVVEEGRMLGVVSVRDIFRRIVPHYVDMDDKLASVMDEDYFEEKFARFARVPIAEIMTTKVDTLAPDEAVIRAVAMFVRLGHKTFAVIDGGKFIGAVTRRSVLRKVARRSL